MLGDVLAESERAATQSDLELVIAVESAEGAALLSRRGPTSARFVEQVGESLAARMVHVAQSARAAGAPSLVMRGSDSPALGAGTIREASRRVASDGPERGAAEVVLSPDPDGGYNLVALSEKALDQGFRGGLDLFDHPMSHARVLEATIERAEAAGLRWELIEESFDIDRAEDIARLEPWRERGREAPCPATLAFVDQHALWPGARPAARATGSGA